MNPRSLRDLIAERLAAAAAALGPAAGGVEARVSATDSRHGDYQSNVALALGKTLGASPREVAQRILQATDLTDLLEPPDIAGPGFINLRLRDAALARYLEQIPPPPADARHDRLGIPPVPASQRQSIVVDYSSPNIAKQLHVGHLRSTNIGDVFARVLSFQGHDVARQNHLGDWGTAIGMVVLGQWYVASRLLRGETLDGIRDRTQSIPGEPRRDAPSELKAAWEKRRAVLEPIRAEWESDYWKGDAIDFNAIREVTQLEVGYQFIQRMTAAAKGLDLPIRDEPGGATSKQLADLARLVTTFVQARHREPGQPHHREYLAWRHACDVSLAHCQDEYARLGVLLTREDVCAESDYHDRLAGVVSELRQRLAPQAGRTPGAPWCELRVDQGAVCIFSYLGDGTPAFRTKEGDPLPMIVQKSDGAYLYDTTDLAAIRYRVEHFKPRRIVYVTDGRQADRFKRLFFVARAAGWADWDNQRLRLDHTWFGTILGADRRPFQTKAGDTVKLRDLLDEAKDRARSLIQNRELSEPEKEEVAQRVSVGAIRYFDLNRDRTKDYVFDWDQMLAMKGNTAPYLMYAYTRGRAIAREAAEKFGPADLYGPAAPLRLADPNERALALALARLREAVDALAAELMPHTLCNYLYDLTTLAMRFYEACPVLAAPDEPTRRSRLRLWDLTTRTVRLGLGLLGISVVERM